MVTVDGKRDILGLWAGTGGEGAKYWLGVLTEIKNRGVKDVCIVCCGGLKGLPEAIATTWQISIVQICVLHLTRNTFRLASRADWDKMAKDLRPVYTAMNETDAATRLEEFHEVWGDKYPAIKGGHSGCHHALDWRRPITSRCCRHPFNSPTNHYWTKS